MNEVDNKGQFRGKENRIRNETRKSPDGKWM